MDATTSAQGGHYATPPGTGAALRTLPFGAVALRACWGEAWLRPATPAEREAWFDSADYRRLRDHFAAEGREFDPDGETHALMTLLDTIPANVRSFLNDGALVVTAGPMAKDWRGW